MKTVKKILAIQGGKKTIDEKDARYPWPLISTSTEKAVIRQMRESVSIYDRSGIFRSFEETYARKHNRKYALLMSSGTVALHSMYVATGIRKGDEVICPAYTFFATVSPLLFTGSKPILCDCDDKGNIAPQEIEKKISSRTKAVVVTHMWGIPCEMDKIRSLCRRNNLILMEDCSHAHGTLYKGKPAGTFGEIAIWSLQGQKNISGGEGGIFLTNNPEYYYRALLLGHYNKRCKQEIPKVHKLYKFAVTGMGLKYRAHPLAVALAAENLKKLPQFLRMKNYYANKIIKALKPYKALECILPAKGSRSSWYSLIFRYHPEYINGLAIERFYDAVKAEGLSEFDRPMSTGPLNLLPLFQKPWTLFPEYKGRYRFSYKPGDFPKSEDFYYNLFKLPVWATKADEKKVNLYIRGLKKVLDNYQALL